MGKSLPLELEQRRRAMAFSHGDQVTELRNARTPNGEKNIIVINILI